MNLDEKKRNLENIALSFNVNIFYFIYGCLFSNKLF